MLAPKQIDKLCDVHKQDPEQLAGNISGKVPVKPPSKPLKKHPGEPMSKRSTSSSLINLLSTFI